MKFLLASILTLSISLVTAQKTYDEEVAEAWKYYSAKQWKESGNKYLDAFKIEKDNYPVNDKYNAGKALAEAGMLDEAFEQFFYIAKERGYNNYLYINESNDLNALKGDRRWQDFVAIVKVNKEANEVEMDKDAVAKLDLIRIEFDNLNEERIALGKEKGYQSEEMRTLHFAQQSTKDEHLDKIKQILDDKGFLGPEEVGVKNRNVMFQILRFSKIETHDEYLPIFHEAFNEGKLEPNQYASIIDRIFLKNENRQVYGSIFNYNEKDDSYYIQPVKNPEEVNLRRKAIGLMSIEEFCSLSNMNWNVEDHKQMTIEFDKKNK